MSNLYVEISDFTTCEDYGEEEIYSDSYIDILSIGPCYISRQGKGMDSHWITNDTNIINPLKGKSEIYIALVTYTTGDTFGTTSGNYDVEYVHWSEKNVNEWIEKNQKRLEKEYGGVFDSLDDVECYKVELVDQSQVKGRQL